MKFNVECLSEKDLGPVAKKISALCPEQCFIALHGNLGVGKTTFVKYLGKCWGIDKGIKSPSFDIMNIHYGTRTLIHMDAYRLSSNTTFDKLSLDDLCIPPFCLVVEWPECLLTQLFFHIHLYFSILTSQARHIQIVITNDLH